MTIFFQGSANPASVGVPGLSVNVQPPPAATLPGAPSDILGIVGTSDWGPVNSPVAVSSEAEASTIFGAMINRKYDLMTQVHAAQMQGAANFRLVRQTDGSETAASVVVQTSGGTATAKYTGTGGALIVGTIATGTKSGTKKVTLTKPGLAPEVFDNIVAIAASNASWIAIASAINAGIGNQGPSNLITMAAGASTSAPVDGTFTLTGGGDGVGSIAQSDLVGTDTAPREGMYCLRETGIAAFLLADADADTTWAAQAAFALSEAAYGFACSPSGDTVANFLSDMNSAGIDTPWLKVIFGDWVYMLDGVNGVTRLVSPQGFMAGLKVAIGPHQSLLNKPLQGIVGTQKSYASQKYSTAELQLIGQARGDVITMDAPGGNYPTARFGRNSSSDGARRQDSYTTMINYLAKSLDARAGVGRFVGRLATPEQMREAEGVIGGFLQVEWDDGRIGNAQGTVPYSVQVDGVNNPQVSLNKGVEKATVMVTFLTVIEYFVVDLTGGSTVQILSAANLQAQVA